MTSQLPNVIALAGQCVLAAEGGEAPNPVAFHVVPFITAIVIFGITFYILATKAWPKILGGLDDRAAKIREEIYAAERARQEAKAAQEQYKKELEAAKAHAAEMLDAARAEQARLAADLRTKAEAELAQLRESAMAGIEAAKRAAISEIYEQAASLSTSIAAKILQRELNPADQQRLVEDAMSRFAREIPKN